jgi:hypothetical protein
MRIHAASALALVLSAAVPVAPVRAQAQLAEYQLPGPLGVVGERVGLAGDVDGDGVQDLLVAGKIGVLTYSGATGAKLGFQPIALVDAFDAILSVDGLGDADGDGQPDLVASTTASGARAFSRASGALLWSVPGSPFGSLGWRMATLADLDGDGVREAVLGEPDADPAGLASAGSIHVISGASGATLHRIDGTSAGAGLGRSLAAFGDLDGDGREDLIAGDPAHKVGGVTTGRVLVLSALDGALLREVVSPSAGSNFAIVVAGGGDLDGDGVPDLVAGSSFLTTTTAAWSGATGEPLWSTNVGPVAVLHAAGDLDGDLRSELVVGGPGFLVLPGTARLLDGATGATLATLSGSGPGAFASQAACGDVTGDGLPDLLVGDQGSTYTGQQPSAQVRSLPSGAVALSLANPPGNTGLGRAADLAGDFDGDGADDVVLVSSTDVAVFARGSGALLKQVKILPGIGGSGGSGGFGGFGGVAAVAGPGDLDGDGVPDLVLGDASAFHLGSQSGRLIAYSGADGSVLHEEFGLAGESLGVALADTTDHDGDGVRDVYVSNPGRTVGGQAAAGVVELRSGEDWQLLATLTGLVQPNGRFGATLSAGGDLDGDGVPELAVGSQEEQPGQLNAGTLWVLDGASGAVVHAFTGAINSGQTLGALVGDGNGDEVPDVLVAEPQWIKPGEGTLRGRIRLFSGASGAFLWERQGAEGSSQLGARHAAAGDVNGDGFADVMASETLVATGSAVRILSGRDGVLLDDIDLLPDAAGSAGALLSLGRLDAGACDDVLIGITTLAGNGGARALASSKGGVHGFTDLGHAAATGAGALPTLHGYGSLAALAPVTIRVRHAPPGKPGKWFIGLSAGYLPFKGGVLVPSPLGPFFIFGVGSDAAGEFTLTAPNPASVFTGLSIVHQFWFADPSAPHGVAASNGLQETFQ